MKMTKEDMTISPVSLTINMSFPREGGLVLSVAWKL